MKAVILAGGFGTRISEESHLRPKPMIEIGEKQINKSLNYIGKDAEKAAMFAILAILKKGEIISGHDNHKGREYDTVTIGAKITINGNPAVVGAVVTKIEGKNKYRVHRVLMPDGSELVFNNEKKNAESTSDIPSSSDKRMSINSASKYSIHQNEAVVNTSEKKYSLAPKDKKTPSRKDLQTKPQAINPPEKARQSLANTPRE